MKILALDLGKFNTMCCFIDSKTRKHTFLIASTGSRAMNELKAVHMSSEEHREFRTLVKYRKMLDQRINKMKCTICA